MSDDVWVHRSADLLAAVASEGDGIRAALDLSTPVPRSPAAVELEQECRLQHSGWRTEGPVARAQQDLGLRAVVVDDHLRSLVAVLRLAPHGASAAASLTRSALETIGKNLWLLGSEEDLGDGRGRLARWAKDTAKSLNAQSNSQGRRMDGRPFAEGLAWAQDLYGALEDLQLRAPTPPTSTASAVLAICAGRRGEGPERTLAEAVYEQLSGVAHADRSALSNLFTPEDVDTQVGPRVRLTLVFSRAATASCLGPLLAAHHAMLDRLSQLHGRDLPTPYRLAVSDLATHLFDEG